MVRIRIFFISFFVRILSGSVRIYSGESLTDFHILDVVLDIEHRHPEAPDV